MEQAWLVTQTRGEGQAGVPAAFNKRSEALAYAASLARAGQREVEFCIELIHVWHTAEQAYELDKEIEREEKGAK